MREWINITEAYTAQQWTRWWGNVHTGQVLPVGLSDGDHDQYLFDHLDEFFTPDEQAALPVVHDYLDPMEEPDPDAVEGGKDDVLEAAYSKGWQAVLLDGNQGELGMRIGGTASAEPKALATITRAVMKTHGVLSVAFDFHTGSSVRYIHLHGPALDRFVRTGKAEWTEAVIS